MKQGQPHSRFMRIAASLVITLMAVFLCTSVLVSSGPSKTFSSRALANWTTTLSGGHFLKLMGTENRVFTEALPDEESDSLSLGSLFFAITTSINPDDPRSLLGRELPGFSLFDTTIHIAGEGTDYTNLPVESSPPDDLLASDQKAKQEALDRKKAEEEAAKKKEAEQANKADENKVVDVYIGTSHTYESFFPELEIDDTENANKATHQEINITMVADHLKQALEQHGIYAQVEERDVQATLVERGLGYEASYDVSREFIKSAKAENDDLMYFFDLHRDSIRRDKTTVTINGETFARPFFVVGQNYAEFESNLQIANELHKKLEEDYPSLSRGVFKKSGASTNGRFNQDLFANSILLEVGGVDNSLEEAYRSIDAFAEVFADYYYNEKEGERE
ncbi:stage II sporulation protein P [Shouchella clausii]|uniref:stage II sporulation protein P n=1 Tax=Shouchella clausii TaxID=79880 RepID=UPI000BA74833|nr:stage II sporulation protein P [Shouchella clausii]PAD90817.1 stage II sporulation protein P [Shouchella clausii]